MKYPDHATETKSVTGERAREFLKIIDEGGSITTNANAKATIQRILERQRQRLSKKGQVDEKVQEG